MRDLIKPYAKRLPYPCPKEELRKLSIKGKNKVLEYMEILDEKKKKAWNASEAPREEPRAPRKKGKV